MRTIKPTVKIALSIVVAFIIIFSIDYLFLRQYFWQRLIVNILLVLIYFVILFKYILPKEA